ncbi:MAG: TonB-dependent receptor [Bacteroidetes bacterium]|nr:TonB-dependent receptor [Bacteroidota bacterium]
MFAASFANAQINITFLSEADNLPIVFAPVKWKILTTGKTMQCQTDIDGKLNISNEGSTVITNFSYLGYESRRDTFNKNGNFTILVKTDIKYLPEAVVTDQYTATNTEKAVQKIIVIDEKKIKSLAAVNLGDLLSNQLNFKINNDNSLGSSLSIMGLNGQNIKILIDGIPVIGRMNGNIDISQINLNDIERIEIIEGPLSVAYGTNALGGAINIITKKKPSKKTNLTTSFYYENSGKYNADATFKYRRANGVYNFSLGRNYFDGWSSTKYLRFEEWKPKEQYFGRFQYLRKIKCFDIDFKSEYFNEKLTNKGVPRQPYYETAFDEYFYTNRFDNSITANSKFKKNRFLNIIFSYNTYSRVKNRYLFNRVTLERTLVPEANEQDTTKFSLFVMRGTFSKSLSNAKLNYQAGYDINLEKGSGQRLKNEIEKINDLAVFTSLEYTPVKDLQIKPGIRYSYNSAFKTVPIPSINFKYSFKSNAIVRTSYAKGFRAPDLKELYLNFVDVNHDITGNPNLKPEKSDNFQISLIKKLFYKKSIFFPEITFYANSVKDRIFLSYRQNTNYTYMNIAKFKSLTGTFNFGYKCDKISGNTGFSSSTISTSEKGFANSATFYEISNNTSFTETKTGITSSLFIKFNSKTYNFTTDENGNTVKTIIPQYFWSDFTLSKSFFGKKLSVNCGIKNILNVKTLAMSGVSNGTHSNGGSYLAGMGRTYFIKIEYNFAK